MVMEWADLPKELLELILLKLFVKDRHNFKLVCRSWNEAAASSAYMHCPSLMFHQKNVWKFLQFNGSLFEMSFPELNKAQICCSKYGWLLMCRDDDWGLFFFDPYNRQKIELPTPRAVYEYTTIHFFDPPTSPNCFIIRIATPIWRDQVEISVLKHGEHKWMRNRYKRKDIFWVSLSSPVIHGGLLYFVDVKGNVATFNMNKHEDPSSFTVYTKCLRFRWLRNNIRQHFLLKIKGDEALYAVFLTHDDEKINVYRLLELEMQWEVVKNLEDKILYLSRTLSFGDSARLKSMGNTIYFPMIHGDNFMCYSLGTGKYHSFNGDCSFNNRYNLPILNYATWITSSSLPEISTGLRWCIKVNDLDEEEDDLNDFKEDDSSDSDEDDSSDSEEDD